MNEFMKSKLSYYIEAYHNTLLKMTSSVERTKMEEELFRTLTGLNHQEIASFIKEFLQKVNIDKFYLEIIKKIYETFDITPTEEIDYIREKERPDIIKRASEISENRNTFHIRNNPFTPFILALEEQETNETNEINETN